MLTATDCKYETTVEAQHQEGRDWSSPDCCRGGPWTSVNLALAILTLLRIRLQELLMEYPVSLLTLLFSSLISIASLVNRSQKLFDRHCLIGIETSALLKNLTRAESREKFIYSVRRESVKSYIMIVFRELMNEFTIRQFHLNACSNLFIPFCLFSEFSLKSMS